MRIAGYSKLSDHLNVSGVTYPVIPVRRSLPGDGTKEETFWLLPCFDQDTNSLRVRASYEKAGRDDIEADRSASLDIKPDVKAALLAGLPTGLKELAQAAQTTSEGERAAWQKAEEAYKSVTGDRAAEASSALAKIGVKLFDLDLSAASAEKNPGARKERLETLAERAKQYGKQDELKGLIAAAKDEMDGNEPVQVAAVGKTANGLAWVTLALDHKGMVKRVIIDNISYDAPAPGQAQISVLFATGEENKKTVEATIEAVRGDKVLPPLTATVNLDAVKELATSLPASLQSNYAQVARIREGGALPAKADKWLREAARRILTQQATDQLTAASDLLAGSSPDNAGRVVSSLSKLRALLSRLADCADNEEQRKPVARLTERGQKLAEMLSKSMTPDIAPETRLETVNGKQARQLVVVKTAGKSVTLRIGDAKISPEPETKAGEREFLLPPGLASSETVEVSVLVGDLDTLGDWGQVVKETRAVTLTGNSHIDFQPLIDEITYDKGTNGSTRMLALQGGKATNIKMTCTLRREYKKAQRIEWQVLKIDDPKTNEVVARSTAQKDFVMTVPKLDPGRYQVQVRVWATEDTTKKPDSETKKEIQVVEPGGMAFIVGVDYYGAGQNLNYLVNDAVALEERLVSLGYARDCIYWIHGSIKDDNGRHVGKVVVSDNLGIDKSKFNVAINPVDPAQGERLSKDLMDAALQSFSNATKQNKPKHVFFLYAGHGEMTKIGNTKRATDNILLPDTSLVPTDQYPEQIANELPDAQVVAIFNCCRDAASDAILHKDDVANLVTIPSCLPTEKSYSGDAFVGLEHFPKGHSLFGQALLDTFTENGAGLTLESFYASLSSHLKTIVANAIHDKPDVKQTLVDVDSLATKTKLKFAAIQPK